MRQLDLTAAGMVAQDIAACVTQELFAARCANGAFWAVAVEALPYVSGTREGGLRNLVPADRSGFDPAVHPLLAAHELAIPLAASTLSAAGIPTACFHAQEGIADGWKPDDTPSELRLVRPRPLTGAAEELGPDAQLTYATEQDGTPADHELCRLGRWRLAS